MIERYPIFDGTIAYVSTVAAVTIVDFSDPTNIVELNSFRTSYPVVDFALVGDLILIKDSKGLNIYRDIDL